jgi:hypothetical protein
MKVRTRHEPSDPETVYVHPAIEAVLDPNPQKGCCMMKSNLVLLEIVKASSIGKIFGLGQAHRTETTQPKIQVLSQTAAWGKQPKTTGIVFLKTLG